MFWSSIAAINAVCIAYLLHPKNRLKKEGSELVTHCNQLKLISADGEYYKTDVADIEQLLCLIQTVPSPMAEPFKMLLAKVGWRIF